MILKNKKKSITGFTLVEILVTVAILAIVSTMGLLSLSGFREARNFKLDLQTLTEVLRNAQNKSILQEGDYPWGVSLLNNYPTRKDSYEIFYQVSPVSSTTVEAKEFTSSSKISNPPVNLSKEIIFSLRSGTTSPNVIALKKNSGNDVGLVSINSIGKISSWSGDELIGYWPLDDNSGATAHDAARLSDGSIVIGGGGSQSSVVDAWFNGAQGRIDKSINFDGTDDYVDLANLPVDTALGGKTSVSMWIYWTASNASMPFSFPGYNLIFYYPYGFGFNTGNDDVYGVPETLEYLNSWIHVVAIFDNGIVSNNSLYINGIKQTLSQLRSSALTPIVSSSARIAGLAGGATNNFGGKIDDLRIYNKALTDDEVKAIYESY